jgi:nucleoside-diphosphate-sugar epimerase
MRIVFTGGSGKAGKHVISYLLSKGHQVLNLDLIPLDNPKVHTLKTDLTDSGQVYNALASPFSFDEYELNSIPPVDAVIHFGAWARNMMVPENATFAANTQSTYNIIEAASKLGIKKIVIASSETVYGMCFNQGDIDWDQFPIEEGE